MCAPGSVLSEPPAALETAAEGGGCAADATPAVTARVARADATVVGPDAGGVARVVRDAVDGTDASDG